MNIPAIILIAAAAAQPVTPFSTALTNAKAEMAQGVAALDHANPALEKGDFQTACPDLQIFHARFAKARDILENARVWYISNQPARKQEPQYLAEDRDSVKQQMAKIDIILNGSCGGAKPTN